MRARLVNDDGQRTYVVVLDTGDEVMADLQAFAHDQRVAAAQVTAIGALSRGTLGFFDWERKDYRRIPVDEQVEVVSLNGDIGVDAEGEPALHLHAVLGRSDGSTLGGHLIEAHVRPTLEVIVTESPAHLHRCQDAETGLSLIRLDAVDEVSPRRSG
jgi:predicted DNA-binding protein with PD1-like motif